MNANSDCATATMQTKTEQTVRKILEQCQLHQKYQLHQLWCPPLSNTPRQFVFRLRRVVPSSASRARFDKRGVAQACHCSAVQVRHRRCTFDTLGTAHNAASAHIECSECSQCQHRLSVVVVVVDGSLLVDASGPT